VIATVKAMASRDDIDPQRVLLVGVSAGGFASIAAAAQHPPGVVAVIAFAPGRGSTGPDTVCQEDKLIQAYGVYGRTIRIPTIWFSAKNDHYFQPALAHRFFAAFTGAGGTGEFVDLPAFGKDGHFLLDSDGVPLWRDRVDAFLRAHQLPTWAKPIAESMPSVRPPRQLGTNGRKGFDSYLADANFEKAFAVNRDGGYGWDSGYRSGDEAAQAALASCRKHGPGCEIYAINNALAR
jgi:pimeloyl-ACP methyl ester carboxylesterase